VSELSAATVREWGQRYSNWGRWGADDERGALNFITRERVIAACAIPKAGRVIIPRWAPRMRWRFAGICQ